MKTLQHIKNKSLTSQRETTLTKIQTRYPVQNESRAAANNLTTIIVYSRCMHKMGRTATLATCSLNQWAMDFEGNLARIMSSMSTWPGASTRLRLVLYPVVDLFPDSRENPAFIVKKLSRQAVLFPYFKLFRYHFNEQLCRLY